MKATALTISIHYIPKSPKVLLGWRKKEDVRFPASLTITEKPLGELLNPGQSQWSDSGLVVVLKGCTEWLACMSVKQGSAESEHLNFLSL